MSVIAVALFQEDGNEYLDIGWDSMTIRDNGSIGINQHSKVQYYKLANKEFWFGNVGYSKRLSMMRGFMENQEVPILSTTLDVLDFMSRYYQFSDEYLRAERRMHNGGDDHFEGESLIIYKDSHNLSVWNFNCFSVEPVPIGQILAIGSGAKAAMGALYSGASMEDAIEATCRVDKSCREPIHRTRIQYN